jgi:transcriptional regulator with XRE-family HTH domain
MTLSQKLRALRKSRGISRQKLSEKLSHVQGLMWPNTIARFECGKSVPDAGQMEHLFKALNATADERADVLALAEAAVISRHEAA